jgi:formate hydrogenlyase subunit 3/multisubunit Na+/H+ antiporter MnhD subunit
LGVLGLFGAFYAVAFGLCQRNPKTILAYSSVSQMGVVMAALGFGLAAGDTSAPMSAAFYAAHHVLAKGALFLAVGVALALGPARWRWVGAPVLLLVLSFGGLPFTGGALAKAATKGQLGDGLLAWLAALSAMGTTLLMLHFAARLRAQVSAEAPSDTLPWPLILPWLGMTLAAVILPWALFVPSGAGTFGDVFDLAKLWAALWPVLAGVALFTILRRLADALPEPPEGDVLVLAERGLARLGGPLDRTALWLDARLRTWPSGTLMLLLAVLILLIAMAAR